ncbi:hypothetical protein Ocin01_19080 [Orchesella cincta]|uniref:Uncharacterized protein n=1 Tax=Orchesella cincta TaxID=48709 RepID=A0A1D2M3U6_ORCCI|nr:hypothetical protein Ocin01_19080 [Orchesella cincta]
MWTFLLLALSFELASSNTISQPLPQQAINSAIISLRKLGCNVDIAFKQEGLNIKIICELEEVMTWLDTWLKPLLIVLIVVTILIATSLVLCCIKTSKLNLDCCGLSQCMGCRKTLGSSGEDSKLIPSIQDPKGF